MTEAEVEIIIPKGKGEISSGEAENNIRQGATVYSKGFQGVHKDFRDEPCKDIAILSTIKW